MLDTAKCLTSAKCLTIQARNFSLLANWSSYKLNTGAKGYILSKKSNDNLSLSFSFFFIENTLKKLKSYSKNNTCLLACLRAGTLKGQGLSPGFRVLGLGTL